MSKTIFDNELNEFLNNNNKVFLFLKISKENKIISKPFYPVNQGRKCVGCMEKRPKNS